MKKLFNEFKAFCMRGNLLDLAVGVMIGGAFGKIVSSLVNDIFMPVISAICGGINVSGAFIALDGKEYVTIEEAQAAGAGTLNYGMFIQQIIDFLLMAVCVFAVIKLMAKLAPKKAEEPKKEPRLCPYCKGEVHEEATRCPHCTSELT